MKIKQQTRRDFIQEHLKTIPDQWFKDHKATLILNRPEITIINWQKPGTSTYGCRFMMTNRTLSVTGDFGDAIYGWTQPITLEFLASIDFDYFWGKCIASEKGRDYNMWDSGVAEYVITRQLQEMRALWGSRNLTWTDPIACIKEEGYDRDNVRKHVQRAYEAGIDSLYCADLSSAGEVPDLRCIGHFVGLQLAIKQLQERAGVNSCNAQYVIKRAGCFAEYFSGFNEYGYNSWSSAESDALRVGGDEISSIMHRILGTSASGVKEQLSAHPAKQNSEK